MATMDTLRAYTILRAQGRFEEHAAQAVVEAVSALLAPPLSDLVTKTDLAAVKTELKADIEQWRLEMKADLADAKAEWHHRLLLVAMTIIGANLTAIAIATGLLLRQLS
jgi:hypothetical protein